MARAELTTVQQELQDRPEVLVRQEQAESQELNCENLKEDG